MRRLRSFSVALVLIAAGAPAALAASQTDLTGPREAIAQRDFQAALTQLQSIVSGKDAVGEAFFLLGLAQSGLGQFPEAEISLNKALDQKYREPGAYVALALVLAHQGRIAEVEPLIDKPLSKAKQPEEKAHLKYGIGMAYLTAGSYSKAQEWLLGARFDDESNLEYRAALGDAYFKGQIYPLALAEYEAVWGVDTTRLDMLYRMADAYYQQQRLNEARPLLQEVLRRDSTYQDAYLQLANIYMISAESRPVDQAREDYLRALALYRQVRRVDPTVRPILISKNIAKVYYLLNAHDSAIVELQKAIETGANDPELRFYQGRSNMLLNNYTEAIDAFQGYITALETADPPHPWSRGDAEVFWRTAMCMEALNDSTLWPQIAQNYKRGMELDPDDERSISGLALALHRMGRFAEAAVEFEKLVLRYPDDARTLFNASLPYLESDNAEKAVEYLMRAAKNDTTSDSKYRARAYKLAGPRLIKMQRLADAQLCYKWLVEREPDVCDNHKWYGFSLFAAKNYAAAAVPLRRAYNCFATLMADNDCGYNDLRWWLSFALYEAGDKDESYKLAKKVVTCEASHSDAQNLMNRIDEEIVEEN